MRPAVLPVLLLMSVAAYAATDMMRSMVIGQSEEAHHRQNRGTSVGTVCRPPGGIVNLDGECLCCGGWGGPGCATRNKCHEVSCANGGTCDPATGFCQCPLAYTGHQCEVRKGPRAVGARSFFRALFYFFCHSFRRVLGMVTGMFVWASVFVRVAMGGRTVEVVPWLLLGMLKSVFPREVRCIRDTCS